MKRKHWRYLTITLLIIVVSISASSYQSTNAMASDEKVFSGWIPYWESIDAEKTIVKHHGQFSEIRLFWFEANQFGFVENKASSEKIIRVADRYKIPIVATISDKMSGAQLIDLVNDEVKLQRLINQSCDIAKRHTALEFDFESFALNPGKSSFGDLKKSYEVVVDRLSKCTKEIDRSFYITVPARVDTKQFSELKGVTWSNVYDYKKLSELGDLIIIMAYDYSTAGSTPGPVAPYKWIDAAIDFASDRIPKEKIVLGFPMYGRAWKTTSNGEKSSFAISMKSANALANKQNKTPIENSEFGSHTFSYSENGSTTEVWFDTANDVKEKAALSKSKSLKGTCMWTIGWEDPQYWD